MAIAFPSGTMAVFNTNTAPPGWTKSTTYTSGSGLRLVSGTGGGSGGANSYVGYMTGTPFSHTFTMTIPATTIPPVTLTAPQAAAHTHTFNKNIASTPGGSPGGTTIPIRGSASYTPGNILNSVGSGSAHTHALSPAGPWPTTTTAYRTINLQFVSVIHASRD